MSAASEFMVLHNHIIPAKLPIVDSLNAHFKYESSSHCSLQNVRRRYAKAFEAKLFDFSQKIDFLPMTNKANNKNSDEKNATADNYEY